MPEAGSITRPPRKSRSKLVLTDTAISSPGRRRLRAAVHCEAYFVFGGKAIKRTRAHSPTERWRQRGRLPRRDHASSMCARMPARQRSRFIGDLRFPYHYLIFCVAACAKLHIVWIVPGTEPRLRYLFEDCVLDIDKRELRRGTDAVAIAPQAFDLLDYLIRNREHVVSKEDLISTVWRGRIVSDAALTTRVNAARTAIGDSGEEQRLIRTLPRKGFRFV